MAVELLWQTWTATTILGGVAMLALAVLLLHVNASHRLNRAFAIFLIVRGLNNSLAPVWIGIDEGFVNLGSLIAQLTGVAMASFLVAYALSGQPRARRLVQALLAVAALAIAVGVVISPQTFGSVVTSVDERSVWFAYGAEVGITLNALLQVLFLAGAVTMAIAYRRARPGAVRTSHLLLTIGFVMAPGLRVSNLVLFTLAEGRPAGGYFPVAPDAAAAVGRYVPFAVVGLLALLFIITIVALEAWGSTRPGQRAQAKRGLLLLLLPPTVAVALLNGVGLGVLDAGGLSTVGLLIDGLFLLDLPLLGTYALVRHQLFGADLTVKLAVRQSTVAAVFIAVFFAVSEGAQELFSEAWGPLFGIVAAAALVFAIVPLQRFGERVASAAMPGVRTTEELSADDRNRVFQDQVRFAWSDGVLDKTERLMLDNLRDRLGLDADEAQRLEAEVVRG